MAFDHLLHDAASRGDCTTLRALFDAHSDTLNINCRDSYLFTPLRQAAYHGHQEAVRILLDNNALVNILDASQRTALDWASSAGHEGVVRVLLERRADVNSSEAFEERALHVAAKKGHDNVVRLLLEYKAIVDLPDYRNRTALHWAASHGCLVTALLLIDAGADITQRTKVCTTFCMLYPAYCMIQWIVIAFRHCRCCFDHTGHQYDAN
jgi:ankyrin repeat protein